MVDWSDAMVSIRLSCVARVSSAFRTGPPSARLGVVIDGGCVKSSTISVTACDRKSFNFTLGNGTFAGNLFTVSQYLVERVLRN